MADNFFDKFDGTSESGRLQITVHPIRQGYDQAISTLESGGNYRAIGPATRDGDRALGKYQVMGKNVGPWTKEALGEELTPQQFVASPEAQDAVFNHKFGGYVDKYGPEGAARAWFAGEGGMNDPGRRDVLGTSVADYSRKFAAIMPKSAVAPQPTPQQSGNFFDQFDGAASAPRQFDERFQGESAPPANPKLAAALPAAAAQLTRGEPTSPAANMAIDAGNQLSAASQGTTPHIDAYNGKLISAETFQDDAGNILYRDPQTGKVNPTDKTKHVALRDPNDNTVKVYARNDATNENPAVSVSRVLAPGLAAGAVTARPAIAAAGNAVKPLASDIFSTAKPYYRAFSKEASGIEIPKETGAGIAQRIRGALDKANFIEELAPAVYKAAGILEKDQPLTVDVLQNVKQVIGRSFNSPDKSVRDAAAVASKEVAKIISEVAPTASENLKTADAIHSTARSLQDLQRKGAVADLRAGRAGYGGNAVNSMRQVLSPIVQRAVEGRMTGFKPDEIAAMREIVEGTTGTNAARLVGQLSPSKGIIQTGGAIAAGAALGPSAVLIPALGVAANKIATIMTGKQIDRLKELVAKRSPAYSQAVSKSVDRFERAQIEFASQPSPNKFAAYISASRALSSGLTKDGIEITSGSLLKSISGPPKAAADSEQDQAPPVPGQ